MSNLEHRYRRLLRLYPRAHRHVHEEEMLDVLLACAAPDQQRPTLAERFDLVRGAVKVRWRHLQDALGPEWSDALAVVSLIAPLLMLACSSNPTVAAVVDGDFDPRGLEGVPFDATEIVISFYVVGWTLVTVAGLAGKRWIAAATAAVLAVTALSLRVADIVQGHWNDRLEAPVLLTGLIAAAALVLSPGPRRGAQLIGVRGTLLAVATAALTFTISTNMGMLAYSDQSVLGLLPYLLLIPAVAGRPVVRLRVAALVVPHVAGAVTYWEGIATGLFTTEIEGLVTLQIEEAYYTAYAVALLSLVLLLLRARAVGRAARSMNAPQDPGPALSLTGSTASSRTGRLAE